MDVPAAVPVLLSVFLLTIYLRSTFQWRARTKGRRLPPGPKPLPFLGNLHNIPKRKPWIGYGKLSAQYGDILYFRILGKSIIVLNSASVISEFLEKHSSNTSDRHQSPLVKLVGMDWVFAMFSYGQRWKEHRRMFWQQFNPQANTMYKPVRQAMARKLLVRILRDPSRLGDHLRFAVPAVMLKVIYDIDAVEENDAHIAAIEPSLEALTEGFLSGKFLVQLFPILRYVPSFLPGTGFQKQYAKWREATSALKNGPFSVVKEAIARREKLQCIATNLLADLDGSPSVEKEEKVKDVCGVALEAGVDTVLATLQFFFLAMSLYPDVVRKAHDELDTVIGVHRLPEASDRDSLVYVNAIIKETYRWQNVGPVGFPHATAADDELRGYFIPAGTVVIPNVWACLQDPEAYDRPDEFRPERFIRDGKLDGTMRDPTAFVFGFGRRICPGRYFAEASLFVYVASILHVFDITPPVDERGQPIKVEPRMSDGVTPHPEDWRVAVKPRSAEAEALIMGQLPGATHPTNGVM